MQHEAINGLVVRVRGAGDHDRYLSVLTAEQGRITMLSKGCKSMKQGQMAVSQMYTYANFEYYNRTGLRILKGGAPIRSFYALSADIDRLNLAAYLCDVACELTDEGEPAEEMLRLTLNSLYAVSENLYPQELIKGAFEMRAAVLSGYAPALDGCAFCGQNAEEMFLDVMNGALLCADCLHKRGKSAHVTAAYDEIREADVICPLTEASVAAIRYVASAPLSRLLAFELADPDDLHAFFVCAETYLLSHVGHGFETLNFYHTMREPIKGTKS